MLNAIYNTLSSQQRIIVFDPDKAKVEIVLDAKSLLFPTDPANTSTSSNEGNQNNNSDDTTTTTTPALKNQAKDTPLQCSDKSLHGNSNHSRNSNENNNDENLFTYPFTGQCVTAIDKLALNIQSIDLVMVSGETSESDDDQNEQNNQTNALVVANIFNNTSPTPLNINSDGILAADKLIDPVTFNAVKFTFADGNQLVYKNGIHRTTKPLTLKNLNKPAISDAISLVAANVTTVHLALDKAKLTFDNNTNGNELKGFLHYRNVNTYAGAYAYVQDYGNSTTTPKVALPLNVNQTATELSRQKALMASRIYLTEDAVNPKTYHAMIYIDNPKQKSLLKVLGIVYDFFPLFGNNTGATQPGGIIDTSQHLSGFFVYALINDFQYNLMLCFHLFTTFDVIEEITYTTLANSGYHMATLAVPSEWEISEADTLFQTAINNGVIFPTIATAIGTLNVSQRSWSLWSAIQQAARNLVRVIVDVVRVVFNAIIQLVTQVARGIGLIFNPHGSVKGLIGFKNQDSTTYSKSGNHFYLPGTIIDIRQSDFLLNGTEVVTSASGIFDSGPLAFSVGGKTLKYTIRISLENTTARVFNANPLWPVVIDLKKDGNGTPVEYSADGIVNEIIPFIEPNLFVHGVANFAAKRSNEMFGFQPDQALVVTEGVVNTAMASHARAMTPAGHMTDITNLLAISLAAAGINPVSVAVMPIAFGEVLALSIALMGILNTAFQMDGDIYLGTSSLWTESTIVHEYGHFVMFNKIDQKFLLSPVTGLLLNYLYYFQNSTYPELGFTGARPNEVRFLEAWAEYFAYNALSTKNSSGAYDVPLDSGRITGSYFNMINTPVDGQSGLEINFGSPITSSDIYQNAIGRDASILHDLYDNNQDTDSASNQSDRISYGSNFLEFVTGAAPAACLLNLFAGTTDPCNYNISTLYSYYLSGTILSSLLNNGSSDVDLMNLYQMHGFLFTGNTPAGNIVTYNPASNTFVLQSVSPPTGIILRGSTSTSLSWSADVSGSYFMRISDNCINGDMSTGANGSGAYTAGNTVVSEILLNQLQPGPNNVVICLQSGSLMEQYSYVVYRDETAPVVTANPPGNSFTGTQNITLTCTDMNGSGCSKIVYSKDGSVPSLTSASSTIVSSNSAYVTLRCNETLQFFATDLAGNISNTASETYSNGTACCTNTPTCAADQTSCVYPTHSVENLVCWWDFPVHFCICGSQALTPDLRAQSCYTTVQDPSICTTTPGACTDNWVCGY